MQDNYAWMTWGSSATVWGRTARVADGHTVSAYKVSHKIGYCAPADLSVPVTILEAIE